jgi:hypothetical protein
VGGEVCHAESEEVLGVDVVDVVDVAVGVGEDPRPVVAVVC